MDTQRWRILLVVGVLVLLAFVAIVGNRRRTAKEPDKTAQSEVSRDFASNGNINLDLARGEFEIVGVPREAIVARCVRGCKTAVHISTEGSLAKVWTDAPESGFSFSHEPKYIIEIPNVTTINLHLRAGNLHLRGVRGDKEVNVDAGNVTLDVGQASEYGEVKLTVDAGSLSSGPWSATRMMASQRVEAKGNGKYSLAAHVSAGKLAIVAAGQPSKEEGEML